MRALYFAIGLGIALLLPLAVYTGVNIFVPGPDYRNAKNYEALRSSASSTAEKKKITQEETLENQKSERLTERQQKVMFYVSFPVGIAAVIIGSMLAVPAVGAGLLFGGIILLAEGCYTYWDKMTAVMRFASVLVSLAIFI